MEPVAVRFGFGAGNLTTSLRPEAIGMDGSVWLGLKRLCA